MQEIEDVELRIKEVLGILTKSWKLIGAIAAGITLTVALLSFFVITPIYQVDSKVFIGKEESSIKDYDNNDVQMYQKLLKTYSELIKTKDLIQGTISRNNLSITPEDVIENLKITPMTDTQILQISYQNKDKTIAKEVLVSIIDDFMRETKQIIPNGNVQVIESAELPERPLSPNKGANIAIALLVGLFIGAIIAFLKEYLDDTFKTKEQTEKIMELPVIGMIPYEGKN